MKKLPVVGTTAATTTFCMHRIDGPDGMADDGKLKARAKSKRYRDKNPEKARDYARKWRAANPEKNKASYEAWAAKNPGWQRAFILRRKYNLTVVGFLALFRYQADRCACCKSDEPGAKGWAVDHCHRDGSVRGILCQRCNMLLGRLGDSLDAVRTTTERFERYLEPR